MHTLDVVIVNWNAGGLLRRTVEALAHSECSAFTFGRVAVVDNASTDGSVESLSRLDGTLPLHLIRNAENRGFAAACNQGARSGEGDLILFLNPDTEVEPDTLNRCVEALASMPTVGAIGPRLVDRAGNGQVSCSRFPTPTRYLWKSLGLDRLAPSVFPPHYLTDFDHETSRAVDQVIGAFLMTHREIFEQLGGFDERFFVYFEEVDYCYRLAMNSRSTYFLSTARAYHKGNGTTEQIGSARLFYSLRSRLAYGYKHFGKAGALLQAVSTLTIEFLARLIRSVANGSTREVLAAYRALWQSLLPRAEIDRHRHPSRNRTGPTW